MQSAEQGEEGRLQLEYTDLHEEFLAAGGMQIAVCLLTTSQGPLMAVALELLLSACLDSACADALAAAGGIVQLLQVLQGSAASDTAAVDGGRTCSTAIDIIAAAVASSLAAQEAAMAAGCVPPLVALVREANGAESGAAARALAFLAPDNEQALLSAGAVAALVQLMQHQGCERRHPLHALNRLTNQGSSPRAQAAAAIAAAGGIPAAVQCLQDESVPRWSLTGIFTVPQLAAGLLGDMAEACPQLAADICAAGAVPRLEHMLRHSVRAEERSWAVTALVHLRRAAASATTGEAAVDPAQSASALRRQSPLQPGLHVSVPRPAVATHAACGSVAAAALCATAATHAAARTGGSTGPSAAACRLRRRRQQLRLRERARQRQGQQPRRSETAVSRAEAA